MNARPGYTGAREAVTERPGDGDHRVEPAKRATLEIFVNAISPGAAGEAVRRGNDRDAEMPRHTGVEDVGPIAMGMDRIGAQAPA